MARPHDTEMPPVTETHMIRAFASMRWVGWTYTAAMDDPLRQRFVRVRAAALRKHEWQTRRTQRVPLYRTSQLGLDGHPMPPGHWQHSAKQIPLFY